MMGRRRGKEDLRGEERGKINYYLTVKEHLLLMRGLKNRDKLVSEFCGLAHPCCDDPRCDVVSL